MIISYFSGERYCGPKAIMAYAIDAVFKDEFWNNNSYQTDRVTVAFKDTPSMWKHSRTPPCSN